MRLNIKNYILIIILTGLFSCEKQEPVHYYIPDEVKTYGDFKIGSYWVYMVDSVNNEDSIWITDYNVGQNEEVIDKKVISVFEKITINITSKLDINNYIEINAEKKYNLLGFGEIDNNHNISYGVSFFYKNGFMPRQGSEDSIIIYNSYSIIGKNYENVLYRKTYNPILNLNDYTREYDTLEYWVAKNVGVIKKIIRNKYENHTYYLKRYNVIQ